MVVAGVVLRPRSWLRRALPVIVSAAVAMITPHLASTGARADVYQRADAHGVVRIAIMAGAGPGTHKAHGERSAPQPRRARTAARQNRDPGRHVRYEPYLREAAARYALPVHLLRAVARVESDFDPTAVSRKGAVGLMQVMPFHFPPLGVADGADTRTNILVGAHLLRKYANACGGDLVLTLASYNAGLGAVHQYRGVPPFRETRAYVARVLRHYHAYRAGRALTRR